MRDPFIKVNYHSHTVRCQHAMGTEREYVEAAIAMGIQKLGFSDHAPVPFPDGYVSRIRMRMEEAEAYVETIRSLAKEYEKDITLFVGFEAEYLPDFFEQQLAEYQRIGIDYLIMGQHFVEHELGSHGYMGAPFVHEAKLEAYVDHILNGMRTGKFTYLAHPDLVCFRGDPAIYEYHMRRLCRELKGMEIPLEINMLGMAEHRNYPNKDFWKLAAEEGCQAIIGVDAHAPQHLMDRVTCSRCRKLAQKSGILLLQDVKLRPISDADSV